MILEKIKNYSNFIKFEHSLFALPFALSAYFLVIKQTQFNLSELLLIVVVLISARTYGMAANRIIDKNIDSLNPRTMSRELITKKISTKSAYIIALMALIIFYITLLGFNTITFLLSPIVIAIFTIYPFTKRFTYMCHYVLGLVYLIAPPAVEIALTGSFSLSTLFLGLSGFFWVSGFDIIYAILDIEFDRKNNIFSIPSKLGIKKSKIISWVSHLITIVLICLIGFIENLGLIYWIGCTILFGLFIKEHFLILKISENNINKAFFNMNAQISAVLLLMFALSTLING
ncbi:MAG: 4-hydroxybenzoate octaprenyltransferase [Dehalococcoidia bacterium]|nr:4-hydroxybenzoate octaprenyltransferase [Dehalococcoidia bacterium]|tara:strand:+ start:5642 stop:6505 length:864 start_codon:yes stop_codon:yes gene_type:complete